MKPSVVFFLLTLIGPMLSSESFRLTIPDLPDPSKHYFQDLLETSFKSTGHLLDLVVVKAENYHQVKRMLERGEVDAGWFFLPSEPPQGGKSIPFALTKGLGGHRILLFPRYSPLPDTLKSVRTLQDFQSLPLAAGLLSLTREGDIWNTNRLSFRLWSGSSTEMIRGLTSPDSDSHAYNYLPWNLLETPTILAQNPGLVAEPSLLIIIPGDYQLWFSEKASRWASLVQETLERAERRGVVDQVISRHFRSHYEGLNLMGRQKIFLRLPEDP